MGFFKRKQTSATQEVISIPVATLWRDVTEFIGKLETEESADWCKCLWRIHPDDQGIKPGHCRICGEKRNGSQHVPMKFDVDADHIFRGIRKTMVDQHPMCTVHTKEGLIIGFIQWITNAGRN